MKANRQNLSLLLGAVMLVCKPVFRVVRGSAALGWRLAWRGAALIRPRLEGPARPGDAQPSAWTPAADA